MAEGENSNVNFKELTMEVCANPLCLEEIVERVLFFLPMKILHRIARVSKTFNKIVKKFKASRQRMAWLLYRHNEQNVDAQIGKPLEVLTSQPSVAIVFISSALHNKSVSAAARSSRNRDSDGEGTAREAKREKVTFISYLSRMLPTSCRVLGLVTDGIVGTRFDTNSIAEFESSKAASCLLLPKLNEVDIFSFKLMNNDEFEDWRDSPNTNGSGSSMSSVDEGTKKLSPSDVDGITGIPSDKTVRLVVLLLTEMNAADSEFGRALVHRYGAKNVVVAGGFGDSILSYPEETPQPEATERIPSGLGIAFCGDRLHITSAVLHAHISDLKDVEKCLRKLVPAGVPPPSCKNSFGLMFACMGRGQRFYDGQMNVESSAFSRIFPGVPLVGLFGNGEIGFAFPRESQEGNGSGDNPESASAAGHFPKLYHSYTSIFVLVTLI